MAIVMHLRWDGATLEQYDQALKIVRWEEDHPPGALFHVASHDGQALRVTDIWESAEDFQRFVETRLMPGVAPLGLPGEPRIEIVPAHRVFAPGYGSNG